MAARPNWLSAGAWADDIVALMPQLIDAALVGETPPIELLLQRNVPDDCDVDPSGHLEEVEQMLGEALSRHGIRPCRRTRRLVAGLSVPVLETVYYRPSEEILFEAMRDPHPVVIASTFEPQRYIDALLAHADDTQDARQIWIWKGASGRHVLEQVFGSPDITVAAPSGEFQMPDLHLGLTSAITEKYPELEIDELVPVLVGQLVDHHHDVAEIDGHTIPFWCAVVPVDDGSELHLLVDDRALGGSRTDEVIRLILPRVHAFVKSKVEELRHTADDELSGGGRMPVRSVGTFVNLLTAVTKMSTNAICIVPDAHHFLDADGHSSNVLENISALKDAYHHLLKRSQGQKIVLLVGELSLPKDLREEALRIELPLPGRRELCVAIGGLLRKQQGVEHDSDAFDDEIMQLSEEAAGMTLAEVHSVLIRAGSAASIEGSRVALRSAKRRHISRTSTLELVDPTATVDLGGMDKFLEWLKIRRKVFTEPDRARTIGIRRSPRGILLLGLPGSGKSLAAKVIAREWQLALVRLDVGAVRDKYVGSSEARIREALKVVEAMAPCILWVDEIDKGLGQADNISSSTADLNIRAALLTWMQEHRYPVFIVATANRFAHLPPELTRAGRFDARFFFGCPGNTGRENIFKVHLESRGYQSDQFDFAPLVEGSLGFTGAEIEQAVTDSLYACFDLDKPLSTEVLLEHVQATKPLIRTAGKALDEVWELVDLGRVEPASSDMLTRSQVAKLIDPYLYRPCYCRLDAIQGFEKQHVDAGRILMSSPLGAPAAAVMNTGEAEWIYVETNFRANDGDVGVFKFMDAFENIERNFVFDTLLADHGLEAIYFEDEALMKRFFASDMFSAYSEMFRVA